MNIVIERDVPVVMRDGTTLRANVYRPAEGGPFPVIMERTPYGKDAPRPSAAIDAVRAAGQGVAVVVQDVRGQAGSEGGSFYMFRDEFADGYDTVEWAAAQPFCERARRALRHVVRREHLVAGGHRRSARARRDRADAGTDRLRRRLAVAHATASSSGGSR